MLGWILSVVNIKINGAFNYLSFLDWASLVAQMVKNLPAVQETWVWSLGREDPLEKGMATHLSILASRIPWTEGPGALQSMGLQRLLCSDAISKKPFFFSFFFFLVVLGLHYCVGFSQVELLSNWGAWASHWGGFSYCGSRSLGCLGFSSCGVWAQ